MSRIKGKYVAKVVVDFAIVRTSKTLPLEGVKERFKLFPAELEKIIKDETDLSTVEVTEESFVISELYECDEKIEKE